MGKTTLASLAALHFSQTRRVTLFSTDPASNLGDLLARKVPRLEVESIDAARLYDEFLGENLEAFLELGDRGTYLDREELKRLFQLSVPGIDELMGWMRIGELATPAKGLLIVDTAPTGHALRMLGSSGHFQQLENALAAMQAKHSDLVRQLARRSVRDGMDDFLERFSQRLDAYRALLSDSTRSAFVPVVLAEPWVVEQTKRLIDQVRASSFFVPLAVLNRQPHDCDCSSCRARAKRKVDVGVEIVSAPQSCVQLDSINRLRRYLAGNDERNQSARSGSLEKRELSLDQARMVFFAGKGGVGKTTTATSVALQLAYGTPDARFTLISTDPAHSLRDVFSSEKPPENLSVEMIDTRAKWKRLRESLGDEIERAIAALTPQGMSLVHDSNVMQQLVEIAPPGADELFAIMRMSDLAQDETQKRILVDTAPTGHFLRLLELPSTAGEWVREFMRLLLRYKELIPPGSLGEQLVQASRALNSFDHLLRSSQCATVVVTRPDRLVIEESRRLLASLRERGVRVSGVVANSITPASDCSCDESRRAEEIEILEDLGVSTVPVERRPSPPTKLDDLRSLIPLRHA